MCAIGLAIRPPFRCHGFSIFQMPARSTVVLGFGLSIRQGAEMVMIDMHRIVDHAQNRGVDFGHFGIQDAALAHSLAQVDRLAQILQDDAGASDRALVA